MIAGDLAIVLANLKNIEAILKAIDTDDKESAERIRDAENFIDFLLNDVIIQVENASKEKK